MEFQSVIDHGRSQVKFYRVLCIALLAIVGIQAVVVPTAIQSGPYVINDMDSFFSLSKSEPWKLTVGRMEGFLKLYLTGRMDWSKENFDSRKKILSTISSDSVQSKLKDSLLSFGAMARNQDVRSFYVLEGYRFSNEKKVIEANVSRIIRVGSTGVVTPIRVSIGFTEAAVTEENPYGLKIIALTESEVGSNSEKGAGS